MVYMKNVPGWERALRVLAGLAMIAYGLGGLPGSGAGYLLAGAGAGAVLSGFFGFCPMCALAGRRLKAPRAE